MKHFFSNIFNLDRILLLGICIMICLIGYASYNFFEYPFYDNDAGYYLGIIRELNEGKVFFKDIASVYTPLAIYLMGIPTFLFDFSGQLGALIVNYVFFTGSTIIMFLLLSSFKNSLRSSLFLALLFFSLCLYYDGGYVMLEPISVFFQLLAFWSFNRFIRTEKKAFLLIVGLAVTFSFLAKQYGLFIMAPIGFGLLFLVRQSLYNYLVFVVGVILPLLVYFLVLNTDINTYLNYLMGNQIYRETGMGTSMNYIPFGLSAYRLKEILLLNTYVLIIPLLMLKSKERIVKHDLYFFIAAISSVSVLYFADFKHYFQYIVPFFIISFGYCLAKTSLSLNRLVLVVLIFSSLKLSIETRKLTKVLQIRYSQQQIEVVEFHKVISYGSQVFLDGVNYAHYFLCGYKSINEEKIGFLFPGFLFPETIVKLMDKNSYILLSERNFANYNNNLLDYFEVPKNFSIEARNYYALKRNDKPFLIAK
ncbi:MAG: ArnT family glycosyltransferase [Marinicellaceae bacterium]